MIKDKISISINPSYFCNFRCKFCYLSDDQLKTPTMINIGGLFERLSEITSQRNISHVDLYGGEIGLLKSEDLRRVLDTIRFFYRGKINLITNLSVINPAFLTEDIELSVSWDYKARENHEKVYRNMMNLKNDFHILMLASDELLNLSDHELDHVIDLLNSLPGLTSLEIKPFSSNQYHHQRASFIQYEEWIKKWITKSGRLNFDLINIDKIKSSLNKTYSAWSDDHIYITPEAKFAVLEFVQDGAEFFKELDSFSNFKNWTEKERSLIYRNSQCNSCEFLGHCLSEHLQPVIPVADSCNGFRNLLKWSQESGNLPVSRQ